MACDADPVPLSLVADCHRCAGVCCVALPYRRSADFPESKPADRPCRHLGDRESPYRCRVHDDLAEAGWRGCLAFDCAGAGPHAVTATYGGLGGWERAPAAERNAVFRAVLPVFEVASYLAEAASLVAEQGRAPHPGLRAELAAATEVVEATAARAAGVLATYDAAPLRALAAPLLQRAAALVRAGLRGGAGPSDRARALSARAPGADLAGRSLRGADLAGADLTSAVLIGADLRGADLDGACLLGADLRGARWNGSTARGALYVPRGSHPAAP